MNQPPIIDPYRTPAPSPTGGSDGRAIGSMVLGIVAAALCCLPAVGPVCGIIAIVLFVRFNRDFQASGRTLGGRGMAIAGLVTGIVGTAIGAIYSVYYLIVVIILGSAGSMLFRH